MAPNPTITDGVGVKLDDPQLRALAGRIESTVRLAGEKAIANAVDPKRFPLPNDPNSLERIIRAQHDRMDLKVRKGAQSKVIKDLAAPAGQRAKELGPLAKVDLHTATPVERLAASIDGLPRLASLVPAAPAQPVAAAAGPVNKTLTLRLRRVVCVDETNGFLDSELGSDEIQVGGVSVDEDGETKNVSRIKVGSFDDGDVKRFDPPRKVTFFNVLEGKQFPKAYHVALGLAEHDAGGGLADFLDMLTDKVRDAVQAKITEIGGVKAGPLGIAIAQVVNWVVGKVFDWLKGLWGDELFAPVTVHCTVHTPAGRFNGGKSLRSEERVARYRGHGGEYAVFYDWLIGR